MLGFSLTRLHRPYQGCGLALLGAVIPAGVAFAGGWLYLKYGYTKPKPRNDSDWGGLAVPLLCMFVIPGISGLIGFVGGIVYAFWRERRPIAS